MNWIYNLIPTVISVVTTLGSVLAFIKKCANLDKINALEERIRRLEYKLKNFSNKEDEILDKVTKIERHQRGIKEDDKKN